MIPIVVLASGRGSNFDAIQNAIENRSLSARILAVISDRPEAPVLEKAMKKGIEAVALPFTQSSTPAGSSIEARRQEHEDRLVKELEKIQPRFIVLAGYKRIVTSHLIEAFRSDRGYSRIVNIHPSLLPAFSGLNSYAQAFQYGVKVTGVTVHLVEQQVDSGPICAQEAFSIADCSNEEEVEERGLLVEHRLYPSALSWILPEKFDLERHSVKAEGRLCVRQN